MDVTRRQFLKGTAVIIGGASITFPTKWLTAAGPRPLKVRYRASIPSLVPMTVWIVRNEKRLIEAKIPANTKQFDVESGHGLYPGDWVKVEFSYDYPTSEYQAKDVVVSLDMLERNDNKITNSFTISGRVESKQYHAAIQQ